MRYRLVEEDGVKYVEQKDTGYRIGMINSVGSFVVLDDEVALSVVDLVEILGLMKRVDGWTMSDIVEFLVATQDSFEEMLGKLDEPIEVIDEVIEEFNRAMRGIIGEFLKGMTEEEQIKFVMELVDWAV